MRGRVCSQEGVALPVAMAMMLVISLFAAAFFSVSLQVNDTSVDDRGAKRALAAAEAGLQVATYRLNQIGASEPSSCLTTGWVALPESGQCPGLTEDVGNGASYEYYVTPEMAQLPVAQRTCVLLPGETLAGTDRCITVIGTAGGVERRVQVRASMLTGAASYKSVGLMSKSLMHAGNSSEITSNLGANGVVHFGNSAKTFSNSGAGIAGAVLHAPGSTYETSGSSQVIAGGRQSVSTPYEFPAEDFEEAEQAAAATNLDAIPPLWSRPSGTTYNTTEKHLRVTGTATLPAGTYLFCRLSMANSAKLRFSNSQPTEIYIDSPRRGSDSPCNGLADPSGTFYAENSNEINKDGREELVEIFLYGTDHDGQRGKPSWCDNTHGDSPHGDKCKSDFVLGNSVWIEAAVYAPNSTVEANNSIDKWIGAIGANKIRFNNSVKFELSSAMMDSAPTSSSGVQRGGWVECSPTHSASGDPESGC